jgi:hypothetical protein
VEALSLEALGAGGVIVALLVALVLWKVVKVAIKVVLFVIVLAALAVGVAMFLKEGRVGLPVDSGELDAQPLEPLSDRPAPG